MSGSQPATSAMSVSSSCPDCEQRGLRWRFTLRGLLYGIFCFPCGLYCCLRRRQQFCRNCHCDVIKSVGAQQQKSLGYSYRNYQAIETGVSPVMAAAYRNAALSTSSSCETRDPANSLSCHSNTELLPND